MQDRAEAYISKVHTGYALRYHVRHAVILVSFLVVMVVFWWLKLTGITIAGAAFCGKTEHIHDEQCVPGCQVEVHIHDTSCYSNTALDLEGLSDWERSMAKVPKSGMTAQNVVAVARSQLGYTESTRNFQVDAAGIRRGITRYGQWYGNPYGDWSAMFASFCLHYAGVEGMPVSGGTETMRLEWEKAGLYRDAQSFVPRVGDLLFISGNGKTASGVAIITGFDKETVTVIVGNQNNMVAELTYSVYDPAILGYGLVPAPEEPVIRAAANGPTTIGKTIHYQSNMFTDTRCFVIYTSSGNQYYAFDGSGNAVPITIDSAGNIQADVGNTSTLLWTVTSSNGAYLIQNLGTSRYLHSFTDNGSGVTTGSANTSTMVSASGGVRLRSNNAYARLDGDRFVVTTSANSGSIFQFGVADRCYVWLDGTSGGLMLLTGSPDKCYVAGKGNTLQLPTTWESPSKYDYTLRGWYDVVNGAYYAPGATVTVNGNLVFYADWVASSYDIGQFNARVADTVSTNDFITTHVFDYNELFNVYSSRATVSANGTGHSESWSLVTGGNALSGSATLDFIFRSWDSNGKIAYPQNTNDHNTYPGSYVTPGLYSDALGELLFSTENAFDPATGTGLIGKQYLGTADHLFQFMLDTDHEYYGYYYYDSQRNAAAYNQSAGRFYVYEYLERTTDSATSEEGSYSDFLPMNSPYVNTNGKNTQTYNYDGLDGEYVGVGHLTYDATDSSADTVGVNFWFGMCVDVKFYLPDVPGTRDAEGNTGNRDMFGREMHFKFSGDDDVWILVDGKLVLDLGGIHGIEGGDINFSTGVVTVDGQQAGTLSGVGEGDHVLTIYYLERGSSQSNCAIYFNLAPRFQLTIQKEDVLTQQLLDGAQFSVFTDAKCTKPAKLWPSLDDYNRGKPATNVFTVVDGVAQMWGLATGKTYYIRETKPPNTEGYSRPNGIIRVTVDRDGAATYHVEVLPDLDGSKPSKGFTVHGVQIDQDQNMFLVVTNAPDSVDEITTVQVFKKWEDNKDHSDAYITAYLTVTDPDGTVRRIREITLSEENGWHYLWTNLPKYRYDTYDPVIYGVVESYESGYYSTVRKITEIILESSKWAEAYEFKNGQEYVLKTAHGCISTTGNGADTGYMWVSEEVAKTSQYALWTAHVSGGTVRLTNGANQTITFYYNNGNPTDFFASTGGETNESKQYFRWASTGTGLRLYYDAPNNQDYYLAGNMNSAQKFSYNTYQNNGLVITPMTKITQTDVQQLEDWAYQIINTPLDPSNETAVTVRKQWDLGTSGWTEADYEQLQITVKLLANGEDTGRTVTLNLKNSWRAIFQGLPYRDANGDVIRYTVEESWVTEEWSVQYGEITETEGSPPRYSTVITNKARKFHGPIMPDTGSWGRTLCMLCGGGIMLASLVYGIHLRRKRERK